MRIATLVHSLDGIGGIAKHVLFLSHELARMGHEVDVYAVEYAPEHCYPDLTGLLSMRALRRPQKHALMTRRPAGSRMAGYIMGLAQSLTDQRQLAAIMDDGYDVVNPHGNAIHWAAAFYKERTGTPVTWLCNDFWPMTYQGGDEGANIAQQAKRRLKQGLVYPFDRLDRRSVRAMDEIVVLSERVQAQMAQHYGVRSTIIRPGVARPTRQIDASALRERLGVSPDTFLFLTVCMLMPRRRLEDAIAAIRLLLDEGHDVRYVIAGNTRHTPAYTRHIQEQIAALDLHDRVTLVGEVPEDELGGYYEASDAFIWPADENQSWGLACMEAMLCGRPVLVSSANGIAEALSDGVHALLFEPRNPRSLAHRAAELISQPELRRALADKGQSLVRDQYSWRQNALAMLEVFDRAIMRQRSDLVEPVTV